MNNFYKSFKKRRILKEGDLCRKCNTPVIKKIPKDTRGRLKRAYCFTYYFYCPNCKQKYMVEKAKITIEEAKKTSRFNSLNLGI